MSNSELDVAVLETVVGGLRVRERTHRLRIAAIEERLSAIEIRLQRLDQLDVEIEDDKLRKIKPDVFDAPRR